MQHSSPRTSDENIHNNHRGLAVVTKHLKLLVRAASDVAIYSKTKIKARVLRLDFREALPEAVLCCSSRVMLRVAVAFCACFNRQPMKGHE